MELRKVLIALVILFAFLAVFYLAGFKIPALNLSGEELPDLSGEIKTIEAEKTFENGTHAYSGVIDKPSPCYSLETEALVRESFPEQVTLRFTLRPPLPDIFCAKVIFRVLLKIIFDASDGASINATLNDRPVQFIVSEKIATSTEEFVEEGEEATSQ